MSNVKRLNQSQQVEYIENVNKNIALNKIFEQIYSRFEVLEKRVQTNEELIRVNVDAAQIRSKEEEQVAAQQSLVQEVLVRMQNLETKQLQLEDHWKMFSDQIEKKVKDFKEGIETYLIQFLERSKMLSDKIDALTVNSATSRNMSGTTASQNKTATLPTEQKNADPTKINFNSQL